MKTIHFTGYHQGLPCYSRKPSFFSALRSIVTELISDVRQVFIDFTYAIA